MAQYPVADCFGRQFPSVQELMAMGKAKAQRYFTNSGWPKIMVGSTAFYMQGNAGESFKNKPIAAYEWRGWNGRVGKEAQYFRVDEALGFWKGVGLSDDKLAENLKEAGITLARLNGGNGTAPTGGAHGRKPKSGTPATK